MNHTAENGLSSRECLATRLGKDPQTWRFPLTVGICMHLSEQPTCLLSLSWTARGIRV